tara:strand:- start:1066 stop:1287 length:222 start_codon:yes stop_codon:yes gene_type:complete
MKKFTVEVIRSDQDPDDLMIPLPDELMQEQGWEVGDELAFDVESTDYIVMRKSNDNDPENLRSSIIRLDKTKK